MLEIVPHTVETPTDERPQILIGNEEIFEAHVAGKLSVALKAPLDTQRTPSVADTPGVAQVSRAIAANHTRGARYTCGALDVGAGRITQKMMVAAAVAAASDTAG